MVYVCKGDRVRDADTALVLFLENDVRRLLVNPDAETFQLRLNDFLVGKWLVHIQYDKD